MIISTRPRTAHRLLLAVAMTVGLVAAGLTVAAPAQAASTGFALVNQTPLPAKVVKKTATDDTTFPGDAPLVNSVIAAGDAQLMDVVFWWGAGKKNTAQVHLLVGADLVIVTMVPQTGVSAASITCWVVPAVPLPGWSPAHTCWKATPSMCPTSHEELKRTIDNFCSRGAPTIVLEPRVGGVIKTGGGFTIKNDTPDNFIVASTTAPTDRQFVTQAPLVGSTLKPGATQTGTLTYTYGATQNTGTIIYELGNGHPGQKQQVAVKVSRLPGEVRADECVISAGSEDRYQCQVTGNVIVVQKAPPRTPNVFTIENQGYPETMVTLVTGNGFFSSPPPATIDGETSATVVVANYNDMASAVYKYSETGGNFYLTFGPAGAGCKAASPTLDCTVEGNLIRLHDHATYAVANRTGLLIDHFVAAGGVGDVPAQLIQQTPSDIYSVDHVWPDDTVLTFTTPLGLGQEAIWLRTPRTPDFPRLLTAPAWQLQFASPKDAIPTVSCLNLVIAYMCEAVPNPDGPYHTSIIIRRVDGPLPDDSDSSSAW